MKYHLRKDTGNNDDCRSPCGERGLKCTVCCPPCPPCPRRSPCGERGLKCAQAVERLLKIRRSPCGERGLKSNQTERGQ